jgi:hypothetical protein
MLGVARAPLPSHSSSHVTARRRTGGSDLPRDVSPMPSLSLSPPVGLYSGRPKQPSRTRCFNQELDRIKSCPRPTVASALPRPPRPHAHISIHRRAHPSSQGGAVRSCTSSPPQSSVTGPHRKPEEHATTRSSTTSSQHRAGSPLEASAAPAILGKAQCTRRDQSRPPPIARAAYTYVHPRTPAGPEAHVELHDRLAHHREQPRRQRDQLRRELRVRHTGGDRRRRPPVPREQHRHKQLEPLRHDRRRHDT